MLPLALGGMLAGIIDTVWTEASYLILPAIMIEDANLAAGVKRATQIVKDNLLLIGISTIGVGWVTGLIGFVSVLAGLALAEASGTALLQRQAHRRPGSSLESRSAR